MQREVFLARRYRLLCAFVLITIAAAISALAIIHFQTVRIATATEFDTVNIDTQLNMNVPNTLNAGTIVRNLDNGGGVWSVWKAVDTLEPPPAHPSFTANLSDALNTPLGDGSYDHTYAVCWNQGRTVASQPQSCRGDIESHWGVASEMYDTFTGTDGNEHRWIGTTARWDGTLAQSFFTGNQIAIGSWDTPTHEYAQFTSSPNPATVAASLQLGGLQVGDFGTALNIVDNDTGNSIFQIGTTALFNKYLSLGSASLSYTGYSSLIPFSVACGTANDCGIELSNSAGAQFFISQRNGVSGTIDMTSGGNHIRCWPGGSGHCQSIAEFDVLDNFGNKVEYMDQSSNHVMGVGGVIAWNPNGTISGANDTGFARNAAGVVEINNGTAGTFRDLKDRNETLSGTLTVTGAFGALTSTGHIETLGTTLTSGNLSSCGTGSPTMAAGSTDVAGQFTEGTTATGCTLTFANTYTKAPFCTCTASTSGGVAVTVDCGKGTTATTMVAVNTSATADIITYHCIAQSGST